MQAVDGIGGNLAILGEQTKIAVILLVLVEDLHRLAPRGLLRAVDLAQVQHGALHGLVGGHALIFHHAEIAVVLAVLFPVGAAQKHGTSRMPELPTFGKRVGLHSVVFQPCTVEAARLSRDKIPENAGMRTELRKSG